VIYPAMNDARHCEAITRLHARTFAVASRFLPPKKRRGAFAVYAFCRIADDIVDRGATGDRETLRRELAGYMSGLHAAIDGRPEGPVYRELSWTIKEFGVPASALLELMGGVAVDLAPAHYATWAELTAYCEGVASSVGEMCTYVFGVSGDEEARQRALRFARTLGVALQHTNILRDVGEDAMRGRCYLPAASLAAFGISTEEVLHNPKLGQQERWKKFMRHEIARARALYDAAAPGLSLLAPDAQRCARACADGYAEILSAIESNDYDSFSTRARVGTWARGRLMWSIWRNGTGTRTGEQPTEPVIHWEGRTISRPEEMAS
jgi:phytoene synthase